MAGIKQVTELRQVRGLPRLHHYNLIPVWSLHFDCLQIRTGGCAGVWGPVPLLIPWLQVDFECPSAIPESAFSIVLLSRRRFQLPSRTVSPGVGLRAGPGSPLH